MADISGINKYFRDRALFKRKLPGDLMTPCGKSEGEKSMRAGRVGVITLENTHEVFPRLYVAGMAANAVFGGPRMGPISGGMLLPGEKVARELIAQMKG